MVFLISDVLELKGQPDEASVAAPEAKFEAQNDWSIILATRVAKPLVA